MWEGREEVIQTKLDFLGEPSVPAISRLGFSHADHAKHEHELLCLGFTPAPVSSSRPLHSFPSSL